MDHHDAIELRNGAGYVPIIPGVIGPERDVNTANDQPLSSAIVGLRRSGSSRVGKPIVTGNSVDTQEVNYGEPRNGLDGNDTKLIEVIKADLIVCRM